MNQATDVVLTNRAVAEGWFGALTSGDMETALNFLHQDVEFINYTPIPGYNDDMAWIGTYHGRQAAFESFKVFVDSCEVRVEELVDLVVDGDQAMGVIHEVSRARQTGIEFEIEFIQRLTIRDGHIVQWKSYTDPSPIIRALRAKDDLPAALIDAVRGRDTEGVRELLGRGANPSTRDLDTGLTVLMIAAGQADQDTVAALLAAGADVLSADSGAGATALHKACQGGSVEVVRALVEAGAFVDAVAPTTGHTPLMDALWFKFPEIAKYLLDQSAGLNLSTHYGFTLQEHFAYELNVNTIGKERLLLAEQYLNQRLESDAARVEAARLMAAVAAGEVAAVRQLLIDGVDVDEVFPTVNGFNDGHTPLLVAARDGHTEIARLLLESGANVNATEPTFGAVPLHKAVYNGHVDLTGLIAGWPGVDLNFQGATNGYTPLHDAIWHGYEQCSNVLLDSGATVVLRGHDGKTPHDLAVEVFGADHPLTERIRSIRR